MEQQIHTHINIQELVPADQDWPDIVHPTGVGLKIHCFIAVGYNGVLDMNCRECLRGRKIGPQVRHRAASDDGIGQPMRGEARHHHRGYPITILSGRIGQNAVFDQDVAESCRTGLEREGSGNVEGEAFFGRFGAKPHDLEVCEFEVVP